MIPRKKRNHLRLLEPILVHEGYSYTFAYVYFLVNILYFFRGAAPQWRLAADRPTFIRLVRATARGTGSILNINSAIIILVASKIFMGFLRRTPLNMVVPFDKAMPTFHALIGSTIAVAGLLHTIAHLINYGVHDLNKKGLQGYTSLAMTGAILFICILMIRLTTNDKVKKYITYEGWFFCHIIGMVVYFSVLVIHGSHHGKFSSWKFVFVPFILYVLDTIFRRWRTRETVLLKLGDEIKAVGPGIVKIKMRKPPGFKYMAGQYCYINIEQIFKYQWHPFSIASSPTERDLTFYIKVQGDWTEKLYLLCLSNSTDEVNVTVRGAFGAPAQHVGQYEHVILISGGVGATPFTSITKYVHNYIMNHTVHSDQYAKSPHDAFQFNFGLHDATIAARRKNQHRFGRNQKQPEEEEEQEPRATILDAPPWAGDFQATNRHGLNSTFLSKIGDAANRTFLGVGKTIRQTFGREEASLGDPNAPIPSRDMDATVSDFSEVDNQEIDEVLQKEGQIYEADILRQQDGTPSMALENVGRDLNAPYPYRNVGVEDGSDIDLLIDELFSWKDRALIILHSVTINWLLLWMMILRFCVVIVGRITHVFDLGQRGLSVYGHDALNIIDLVLSIFLFIPVAATLMTEITAYGLMKFFYRAFGNVFDFFILVPLAFICVLLHILGFLKVGENSHHVSKVIVFGLWPVLSVFLLWRILRTIGPRVALAQFFKARMARTKSLDFLLVNRFLQDDEWLLSELLPIASSGPVRIHRFLTGKDGNKEEEKWKKDYINEPLKTTYTRPDWNKVFHNVVENSRSGSVIGVFFCGPSNMERYVQEAAMNAMQQSIKNGFDRNYDAAESRRKRASSEEGIHNQLNDAQNELTEKWAYGCNIRISVRAENFS